MISLDQSLKRLAEISELKDGWIDADTKAISRKSIISAQRMITTVMVNDITVVQPGIFPTPSSGISIEFDMPYATVDIIIESDGQKIDYRSSVFKRQNGKIVFLDENEDIECTMSNLNEISKKLSLLMKKTNSNESPIQGSTCPPNVRPSPCLSGNLIDQVLARMIL